MSTTRSTPTAEPTDREPWHGRALLVSAALTLALAAAWLLEGSRGGAGLAAALTMLLTGVLLVGIVHAPDPARGS